MNGNLTTRQAVQSAATNIQQLGMQLSGGRFRGELIRLVNQATDIMGRLEEQALAAMLVAYVQDCEALHAAAHRIRGASFALNMIDVCLYRDDCEEGGWVTVSMNELEKNEVPSLFFRQALREADANTSAQEIPQLALSLYLGFLGAKDLRAASTTTLAVARSHQAINRELPGLSPSVERISPTGQLGEAVAAAAGQDGGAVYLGLSSVAILDARGELKALPDMFATKDAMTKHCKRHGLDHKAVRRLLCELRKTQWPTCMVFVR